MRLLAFDIGTRHTGVAVFDDAHGLVLPLDTLHHPTDEDLLAQLTAVCAERGVTDTVLGLPLLPGGSEGSQARFVRGVGSALEAAGIRTAYLDERFTTLRHSPADGDAHAACAILGMYLKRHGQDHFPESPTGLPSV